MKPILGIAVLLTWFARCDEHGFYIPDTRSHGKASHSGRDDDSGVEPAPLECNGPPGLYAAGSCSKLAEHVRSYRPKYELWGDGSTKERFVYLPPDTQIDTSNPDRWAFPQGTRFYKTFSLDGVRLETRVIEKVAAAASVDSWTFTAYAWSQDQLSVAPADAAGASNVLGTAHDIPSQAQCKACHTMPKLDGVNGFGAIQLNHLQTVTSLDCLINEGLLVNGTNTTLNVSAESARIPGDHEAQAALGYLHANCGHCHGGPTPRANLTLWSLVGTQNVSDAPAFKTATCQCLARWVGRSNTDGEPYVRRVATGHAESSGIIGRMSVRGAGEQMPPLGTEMVDAQGVATVSAWIDSLDPTACDAAAACPPPAAAPTAGAAALKTGAMAGAGAAAAAAMAGASAPAAAATAGTGAPGSAAMAGAPAPAPQ
jgi:hypothetical protein